MIGYVYKIIHRTDELVLPYVGSTKQGLSKRMAHHRNIYKSWLASNSRRIAVFELFKEYGIENFIIVELARYEIKDRQELFKYEQEWINKLVCCNKQFAHGRDKEKIKQYYQSEKGKALWKRFNNKEERKEYARNYSKKRLNDKFMCEICNIETSKTHVSRHQKTNRHQANEALFYFNILPFTS